MSVFCECCVLCRQQPLRRADHSCREALPGVWVCLIVCDLETSTMRRPRSEVGCCATGRKWQWPWRYSTPECHSSYFDSSLPNCMASYPENSIILITILISRAAQKRSFIVYLWVPANDKATNFFLTDPCQFILKFHHTALYIGYISKSCSWQNVIKEGNRDGKRSRFIVSGKRVCSTMGPAEHVAGNNTCLVPCLRSVTASCPDRC
jgi:hypothetical protein